MHEVQEVINYIQAKAAPLTRELDMPVKDAAGHHLTRSILARQDLPAADNAALDGYVFRKGDLDEGKRTFPVSFSITPEMSEVPPLKSGQCASITTGSPMPEGGDFLVPVEQVDTEHDQITVRDVPAASAVRKKGEGYHQGEKLLEAGTALRPYEMGMLVSAGIKTVPVYKPVSIGIQVTGDEMDDTTNSNGPVIEGLLNSLYSVDCQAAPAIGDDPEAMVDRFDYLLDEFDILITTGGISKGSKDYVYQSFKQLDVNFEVTGVNQKPGKPLTIGKKDQTMVFCLPGNPVSAVFCCELYVRLALQTMLQKPLSFYHATAETAFENKGGKTQFLLGQYYLRDGQLRVSFRAGMASHLMHHYASSNCYVKVEPERSIRTSDRVEILPFTQSLL